jgi:hypothetical protein
MSLKFTKEGKIKINQALFTFIAHYCPINAKKG